MRGAFVLAGALIISVPAVSETQRNRGPVEDATIVVNDGGNVAAVVRRGQANHAEIAQTGQHNLSVIVQRGDGNSSVVRQDSGDNRGEAPGMTREARTSTSSARSGTVIIRQNQ